MNVIFSVIRNLLNRQSEEERRRREQSEAAAAEPRRCPSCRAEVGEHDAECPSCGARLD